MGTQFSSVPLSENCISTFFIDLEPSFFNGSTIKYSLFEDEQLTKLKTIFYGKFFNNDLAYLKIKEKFI